MNISVQSRPDLNHVVWGEKKIFKDRMHLKLLSSRSLYCNEDIAVTDVCQTGVDPGFPNWGAWTHFRGCGPPTRVLFGKNVCENERMGSHWGRAPENFVCRSANAKVSTLYPSFFSGETFFYLLANVTRQSEKNEENTCFSASSEITEKIIT